MVARERFELSSEAPEAPMLGHYTTGLKLRASNLPKNKIVQKNIFFLFRLCSYLPVSSSAFERAGFRQFPWNLDVRFF